MDNIESPNNVFKVAPFGRWDLKTATRFLGPLTQRYVFIWNGWLWQ